MTRTISRAVLSEQTAQSMQAIDIITSDAAERFAGTSSKSYEEHRETMRSLPAHRLLVERLSRIPHTDFVALIGRDGQLLNTSRTWPAPAATVTDGSYYIDALKNNGRHLFGSDLVRNRLTGERNIVFSRRITGPDGDFIGVVMTEIKPSYFQHIYHSITSLRNQSFLLLRSDGTVLVRYPRERRCR